MPKAVAPRSARSGVAAEAILSDQARTVLESLRAAERRPLEDAIAAIEAAPDWGASPQRFIAPADSRHSGHIVDLSVPGWAIVYRLADQGAHVLIPDIYRFFVG